MAALLLRITRAAVLEIDGAEHACISLVEGRTVRTHAATDDLVRRVDERESELHEGPCITSLRHAVTVRSDDFAIDRDHDESVAMLTVASQQLNVRLRDVADNLAATGQLATR